MSFLAPGIIRTSQVNTKEITVLTIATKRNLPNAPSQRLSVAFCKISISLSRVMENHQDRQENLQIVQIVQSVIRDLRSLGQRTPYLGSIWMVTRVAAPKRSLIWCSMAVTMSCASRRDISPFRRTWASMAMRLPMRRVRRLWGSVTSG